MSLDGLISLLIACIELVIIINLVIFCEKNAVNKLVTCMIGFLFGYQFIEFLICYMDLQKQIVIYLAFLDITILPPLGLFATLKFANRQKDYHYFVFVPALFFILYYPFVLDQFAVTKCTVLYASFHYPLGSIYAVFYYLPILAAMIILNKKWGSDKSISEKSLTRLFFFGYLFTFVPAMLFALLIPSFINAVESLLCKLAFIFAIFLTLFVLKNRGNINEEKN